jgi:hypothetical protein
MKDGKRCSLCSSQRLATWCCLSQQQGTQADSKKHLEDKSQKD